MLIGQSNALNSVSGANMRTNGLTLTKNKTNIFNTTADFNVNISSQANHMMDLRKVTDEEKQIFVGIYKKANESGAYSDPKAFLNKLSSKEIDIVRRVHCLANDIYVKNLNYEGASNLLKMPDDYTDMDNNGLYTVGCGNSRVFPPTDAPDGMKNAWDTAMAGIEGTVGPGLASVLTTGPFRAMEFGANIKYDQNGTAIGTYHPTEPGYTNIYQQPGFSYLDLVDKCLANLNKEHETVNAKNEFETKIFLENLKQELIKNGID